jgi:tRNA(fMet)-specific endonuclease VapC
MIIYDTDIFSLMQRGDGLHYPKLIEKVCRYSPEDIKITIISFEEQAKGWLGQLAKAKKPVQQIEAYARLLMLLRQFSEIDVLPFDGECSFHFERLRKTRLRIGTLDLRIAAIAIAHSATLVTRNTRDFEKVIGLKIEDWTKD